ncbi:Threonine dehydratase [Vigna angularis]|uniref:Threonine dehydratase n=1 Tax=Phaseolus angularis TaxID=3914 RepID=A0A8T0JEZ4_PHAAN|nr:Threonine dehydratase [Vigna angularis]
MIGRKYNIFLHLIVAPTCIKTLHLKKDTQPVAPLRPRVSPDSLQYPPGYVGAVPHQSRSDNGGDDVMNVLSYLTNILTSKVYDVVIESSLQLAPKLFRKLGVKVWLKREDLQPVFSFKIREAYNMMAKLPRELLEKGVICSTVIVM